MYEYRGTDRRGTARTGRVDLDGDELWLWVRRRFRQGWTALSVREVGGSAYPVAEILPSVENPARRTWWSE